MLTSIRNVKVIKWKFLILYVYNRRLQNSCIFCEREQQTIFGRKIWSEGEWWETLKNTAVCHAYIKLVQNYPFSQQREIHIGLILMQSVIKCQSHLIKKIETPYQFHWKARFSWENERCWLGWTCERFRICFERGAKGSCGIASQRKRCFWCAAYGLWKKPDISAVCFDEKQSLQLAKCFSRTVNKRDRLNTTPTCGSCHLYICRLFFCLSTFLSLHSCSWRAFRIVL